MLPKVSRNLTITLTLTLTLTLKKVFDTGYLCSKLLYDNDDWYPIGTLYYLNETSVELCGISSHIYDVREPSGLIHITKRWVSRAGLVPIKHGG